MPSKTSWRSLSAYVVFNRNVANREKKIDTQIATYMIEHSYTLAKPEKDEFTLIAGDADFVPVIGNLGRRGFRVDVCFWEHASRELKEAAFKFVDLNPWLDYLALRKDRR